MQLASDALLRLCAEHEAAHSVVADALGYPTHDLVVRSDGSGVCRHAPAAGRDDDVIRVAGDIWVQLCMGEPPSEWYRSSDTDTAHVAARRTRVQLAEIQLRVYGILRQRRADVLALATRIFTDTTWAPARQS